MRLARGATATRKLRRATGRVRFPCAGLHLPGHLSVTRIPLAVFGTRKGYALERHAIRAGAPVLGRCLLCSAAVRADAPTARLMASLFHHIMRQATVRRCRSALAAAVLP